MEEYLLHFMKNCGIAEQVNQDLFRKYTHDTKIEDVKFVIRRINKAMTLVGLAIRNDDDKEIYTKLENKTESHVTSLIESPALVHTFTEKETKAIIWYWVDRYNHYHGLGAVLQRGFYHC